MLAQRLSRLFNYLLLHRHFYYNLLDRCLPINCHSRTVGILWREHCELTRMHHEMVAIRLKEVNIIFRAILRFHDAIQRFPAHPFAAFHDILDVSVGVVGFPTAFLRQMRLVRLHEREYRIAVDLVTSYR